MYNDILRKRIAVEQQLNGLAYRTAPLGALCSHTVNRMVIRNNRMGALRILADWIWLFSRLFTRSGLQPAQRLCLLPNETQRGRSQFRPVQELMQPGEAAFVLVSALYKGASPAAYGRWLLQTLPALPRYIRLIRACHRRHRCFSLAHRIVLLQVMLLQTLRYEIALHRLRRLKPRKLVVDLDRGYFQAPAVLAGNALGAETITLVHGIIFPPYLYVPVIARTVYCWGSYQEHFFRAYNDPSVRYVITGNPAFRNNPEPSPAAGSNVLAGRLKNGQKVITCVSQNFSDQAQYGMIRSFCSTVSQGGTNWLGVVKAHPADQTDRLQRLLEPYPGIVLLGKETPLEQVLEVTDLFMVVNSNLAFDAVLSGKPVFFWHLDEERAGLARIFREEAGAVVLNNEHELAALLQRCTEQGIGQQIHAASLAAFAASFCAYSGGEAARLTRQTLISD